MAPTQHHNTGGSIASTVVVRISHPARGDREAFERSFEVPKPIRPDSSELIPGTENQLDPRMQVHMVGEKYMPVEAGEDPDAWYAQAAVARVTWRDYRGKTRRGRLRLR